jgi:hypothetical protein
MSTKLLSVLMAWSLVLCLLFLQNMHRSNSDPIIIAIVPVISLSYLISTVMLFFSYIISSVVARNTANKSLIVFW